MNFELLLGRNYSKRKPGGGGNIDLDLDDPKTRGRVTEPLQLDEWKTELRREGYTEVHRKGKKGKYGGWVDKAFTHGGAGPDLVAVDHRERKILVGDVTAGPHSLAEIKSGGVRKLPHGSGEIEKRHHLEKTIEDARQLSRNLPDDLKGYKVVARDRYGESNDAKFSREITVVQGGKSVHSKGTKVPVGPSRLATKPPIAPATAPETNFARSTVFPASESVSKSRTTTSGTITTPEKLPQRSTSGAQLQREQSQQQAIAKQTTNAQNTSAQPKPPITKPSSSATPDATARHVKQDLDKALAKHNLSNYPPDGKGPVLGRLKDGKSIHKLTTATNIVATAISLGTDTDISMLGAVEWYFNSTIDKASKELDSKYPHRRALLKKTGMSVRKVDYDAAWKTLTKRSRNYKLALAIASLSPPKDRKAMLKDVNSMFAIDGLWNKYLKATDAFQNAAWMLQQELGDSPWVLPDIAADIERRASILSEAGNDLENIFWKAMRNPLAWLPSTYYSLLDLYRIVGIFKSFGSQLNYLSSSIHERARSYRRLWNESEADLDMIHRKTKTLSRVYRKEIPEELF